jgi:hypothetical protein
MKRLVMLGVMSAVVALNGCVSGYVLKDSKQQVAMRKATMANNERAIKDMKDGKSHKEAGVEVSNWEAIKEQPLIQTGALIADGLIIWGGAEGVQWIADQSGNGDGDRSNSNIEQDSGRDIITVEINGDGNTVDVSGDTTTIGSSK